MKNDIKIVAAYLPTRSPEEHIQRRTSFNFAYKIHGSKNYAVYFCGKDYSVVGEDRVVEIPIELLRGRKLYGLEDKEKGGCLCLMDCASSQSWVANPQPHHSLNGDFDYSKLDLQLNIINSGQNMPTELPVDSLPQKPVRHPIELLELKREKLQIEFDKEIKRIFDQFEKEPLTKYHEGCISGELRNPVWKYLKKTDCFQKKDSFIFLKEVKIKIHDPESSAKLPYVIKPTVFKRVMSGLAYAACVVIVNGMINHPLEVKMAVIALVSHLA